MICPLCDEWMSGPRWRIRGLAVAHCVACGFVGADLDEWRYPYENTDYYDAELGEHTTVHAERPAIRRRVAGITRRVASGRVAELGAGMGATAIALAQRGYRVDAVDESRAAIGWLREHYPAVRWHQARVQDFVREHRAEFDVVTLYHVLEHVPRPRPFCGALRAALRDGGLLVVEVPDAGGGQARLAGRRWQHWVPHHVNYFTAATLRRLLESEGFRPAGYERKYHMCYPQGRRLRDVVHGALALAGLHDILCTYWTAA